MPLFWPGARRTQTDGRWSLGRAAASAGVVAFRSVSIQRRPDDGRWLKPPGVQVVDNEHVNVDITELAWTGHHNCVDLQFNPELDNKSTDQGGLLVVVLLQTCQFSLRRQCHKLLFIHGRLVGFYFNIAYFFGWRTIILKTFDDNCWSIIRPAIERRVQKSLDCLLLGQQVAQQFLLFISAACLRCLACILFRESSFVGFALQ